MTELSSPLELLQSYQLRVLDIRADIPVEQAEREEWSGLAFRMGDHVFISPMVDIEEIVDAPECARVPNSKPWFIGIGNVRGSLVAVSDLHGFVYQTRPPDRRNSRVLTCNNGESSVGLLVDEVMGLRRFFVDEKTTVSGNIPDALVPFVENVFKRDDDVLPVFNLKQFINSSDFLQIAR